MTVSIPRPCVDHGWLHVSGSQSPLCRRKKGGVLTSEAPLVPNRRFFRPLMSSFRINDLHKTSSMLAMKCDESAVNLLGKFEETQSAQGKEHRLQDFAKVACGSLPLKGVVPNNIS